MPDDPNIPQPQGPRPARPRPRGALFDLGFPSVPETSPHLWQPPPVEDLQRDFPQYEISAFLARGGMGAVYKGVQKSLDRTVAIKILPPGIEAFEKLTTLSTAGHGGPHYAQRFRLEARAMAQLSHPNIVTVHEAGETASGLLYFVMEFVEGTDVAQLVAAEGRLDPSRALQITASVCDALAFAHEQGIIHRDIKPSNVMLDKRGRVKVADFGLAKIIAQDSDMFTRGSVAVGTADFIAPEALIPGVTVDHRADLYATGVMLYQMLTGKIPRGRFDPPSGMVPQLDPRVDAIVDKALQTDPERRFSSAVEIKQMTEAVAKDWSGRHAPPPVSTAARRSFKKPLSIGVTVLAMAGGALLFFSRGRVPGSHPSSRPAISLTASPDTAHAAPTTKLEEASIARPFVNSLDMRFVPVPGTKVLFSICDTRVKDYTEFAKARQPDESWKVQRSEGIPYGVEPDHPVIHITWHEAQDFCRWLTEKETAAGALSGGAKYRLPRDEEWSRAVGLASEEGMTPEERNGRNQVDFPWGQGFPPATRAGNYQDETWHEIGFHDPWIKGYTDGYAYTSPAGAFPANAFGLYDMGGNVWQWCEDWFDASRSKRVMRGSSWGNYQRASALSSARAPVEADNRDGRHGFRCVLEPAPSS